MRLPNRSRLGPVCFSFLELSSRISHEIQPNGTASRLALPKPSAEIGRLGKAPPEVLRVASRSFHWNQPTVLLIFPYRSGIFTWAATAEWNQYFEKQVAHIEVYSLLRFGYTEKNHSYLHSTSQFY
jgi:hypothetical protein